MRAACKKERILAKCHVVPKFIPDEFQEIKVITIKPQGLNHALLSNLLGLWLHSHKSFFYRAVRRTRNPMGCNESAASMGPGHLGWTP